MQTSEKWLWGVVLLLAMAVGAVAAYKYFTSQPALPVRIATADANCDLHQTACTSQIPGLGTVSLSIYPHPIPVVQPLKIVVDTAIKDVRSVEVDFSGINMNMGYNRFRLETTAPGHYEGDGMLPVCVRNRMLWEAKVFIERNDMVVIAPFRFDTVTQH